MAMTTVPSPLTTNSMYSSNISYENSLEYNYPGGSLHDVIANPNQYSIDMGAMPQQQQMAALLQSNVEVDSCYDESMDVLDILAPSLQARDAMPDTEKRPSAIQLHEHTSVGKESFKSTEQQYDTGFSSFKPSIVKTERESADEEDVDAVKVEITEDKDMKTEDKDEEPAVVKDATQESVMYNKTQSAGGCTYTPVLSLRSLTTKFHWWAC